MLFNENRIKATFLGFPDRIVWWANNLCGLKDF